MPMKSSPPRLREVWVIAFLLGVLMINYPFIHIFNKPDLVFGYPLLFLYFILGWPLSIVVIYLFSRNMKNASEEDDEDTGERGGQ